MYMTQAAPWRGVRDAKLIVDFVYPTDIPDIWPAARMTRCGPTDRPSASRNAAKDWAGTARSTASEGARSCALAAWTA